MVYVAVSQFGRRRFVAACSDTWKLRAIVRERIGRRRSARCEYRQIGANSLMVTNRWGWVLLYLYRQG